MPRIGNIFRRNRTTTPSTPASGATNNTPTNNTTNAPGNATTPAGPNAATNAAIGNVSNVSSTNATPTNTPPSVGMQGNRSIMGTFSSSGAIGHKKDDGSYTRGRIEVNTTPTKKGCKVEVFSMHTEKDDNMTYILQARVRDKKEEKVINLKMLLDNEKINPDGFETTKTFDVDYDEINAYLKQFSPNLKLSPGTPLAVQAYWGDGIGFNHQWGGYARDGMFYIPQRKANPLPEVAEIDGNKNLGAAELLPLDIGITFDDNLSSKYKTLAQGGQFTSRMEAEVKAHVDLDKVPEYYEKLAELATNPRLAERVLGPGWDIELKERYFLKDDEGNTLYDDRGLPQIDPMRDRYYDNKDYGMAKEQVALRFREKEGDKVGRVNIKPGPGVMVDDNIARRIEYGLEVVPGTKDNPKDLTNFFNTTEHLNPFRFIQEVVPNSSAWNSVNPMMDLEANRYKIAMEHKNGTKIEISLDDVYCTALDSKGKPAKYDNGKTIVGHFAQLELDLEHLQTKASQTVGNSGNSFDGIGQFTTVDKQEDWLKKVSNKATMSGPPRIHQPEDINNGSLLESDAYKLLEKVAPRLQGYLEPEGLKPATQKYHRAAEVTGRIPMSDEAKNDHENEIRRRQRVDKGLRQDYSAAQA